VRVFVTGGAGFIGGAVVRRLLAGGHGVTAVVRGTGRARSPEGATVVTGDLSDAAVLAGQIAGHDAVVHVAGSYRIGLRPSERPAMWDSNVGATERVIDAAVAAGAARIVHVSTVNAFGNTRGRVVDESYVRNVADGFLSWYDETKYRAHEAALARIAKGLPVLVAMPGGVYGPGDHFAAGRMLEQAYRGSLGIVAFGETGLTWVHVEDAAAGIVGVLERGRIGQSYVVSGPTHRLREAYAIATAAGGHRKPRFEVPAALLRGLARLPGSPATLREAVSASAGVTYWASYDKAARELGYEPRGLEQGVRDAWG
jgi:dihydroflavonol-4-reductase